ncbi:flavoprotein [Actinoplanes sp. M2I2]|uniref:flavoprotein n=1 Tax=Actinoplanes sp. M2I2 TaxID=1734444 RepID=UPI00202265EF|nr:flavoprotein [Actinoplanes sp. M2I2]
MPVAGQPVVYVVACGGRPAADLPPFVIRLQADGWHVCVIATPSAVKFMDLDALATITGHQVRYDFKQPDEPDALPFPDAYVIAPATFNTVNKMASGASDTLALGMLNEAIGLGLPIIAVPTPNVALARHPAFQASVRSLRSWGVTLLFDPDRYPLPTPNMGAPAAGLFPWSDLASAVSEMRKSIPVVPD